MRDSPWGRFCLPLMLLVLAVAAHAQTEGDEVPRTKPVNLQVLPKDLSGARLGKLMKQYTQDLGVQCSHCHVENPQTRKLDYVSDDVPAKQAARVMIAMLNDINEKYLTQLGRDARYSVPVTCGSCHQGRSSPPEFEARLR